MNATRMILAAAFVLTLVCLGDEHGPATLPICCSGDAEQLTAVPMSGVSTTVTRSRPDEGGPGLRVDFTKSADDRRFIALEALPRQPLTAFRALDMSYRVASPDALPLRFGVMLLEADGGAWCRVGRPVQASDDFRQARFSMEGLREAEFSSDESGQLEWSQVERIWIGFVADGAGVGSFELRNVMLTSEPYRPTDPVPLFSPDAESWSVGADPAVTSSRKTIQLEGRKALELSFTFPGGRHMYMVPSQPVPDMEYSAYLGLRLHYRASVPEGIDGLLVSVYENGGQFVATPPPPATAEWNTVTIPWDRFTLGSWSKDNNGKLDPDAINSITVGAHGVARGKGGQGSIVIDAIDVVPRKQ